MTCHLDTVNLHISLCCDGIDACDDKLNYVMTAASPHSTILTYYYYYSHPHFTSCLLCCLYIIPSILQVGQRPGLKKTQRNSITVHQI